MKNIIFICLLAVIGFGSSVEAATITVPNSSFENPSTSDYTNGNANGVNPGIMSDWSFSGTTSNSYGVQRSTTDQFNPGQITNSQFGYINANDTPGSVTSGALTGINYNTQYTLTVALGKRLDAPGFTDEGRFTLNILNDGAVVASTIVNGTSLTAGNLTDYSVTWSSGSTGTGLLSTQIIWDNFFNRGPDNVSQGPFDNVRLDAISTVPEPTTFFGGALATLFLFQRLAGRHLRKQVPFTPRATCDS